MSNPWEGKIEVEFKKDNSQALVRSIPGLELYTKEQGERVVSNAMRVYFQLRKVAKGDHSVTVLDSRHTKYVIKLEE